MPECGYSRRGRSRDRMCGDSGLVKGYVRDWRPVRGSCRVTEAQLSFLSLFPQYRSLEARLSESDRGRIAAEDRERAWQARCEIAEGQRDKAESKAERAHKVNANWMAAHFGSNVVPHPDVYVPPAREEDPIVDAEPRRKQGRSAVVEAELQFFQEYDAMVTRTSQQ